MAVSTALSSDQKEKTIRIDGRFDFTAHQEFVKAYKSDPKGDKSYVVDLKNTEYMDSSAMGMLLQLREYAARNQVKLKNANDTIAEILRIANFGKLFQVQ
ncbi:MAG TPA: anti-sigma factor antagonist [Planctomycetaceae bacterium]|nr:anti-sigma factor antagonist [Planctomycetaceae bacterium]